VRAVTGDTVITAATVRTDGSFTLSLPVGERYRLEVLTTSGVRHVVASKDGSLTALTFAVCDPLAPYDIGGIGPNDGRPVAWAAVSPAIRWIPTASRPVRSERPDLRAAADVRRERSDVSAADVRSQRSDVRAAATVQLDRSDLRAAFSVSAR